MSAPMHSFCLPVLCVFVSNSSPHINTTCMLGTLDSNLDHPPLCLEPCGWHADPHVMLSECSQSTIMDPTAQTPAHPWPLFLPVTPSPSPSIIEISSSADEDEDMECVLPLGHAHLASVSPPLLAQCKSPQAEAASSLLPQPRLAVPLRGHQMIVKVVIPIPCHQACLPQPGATLTNIIPDAQPLVLTPDHEHIHHQS